MVVVDGQHDGPYDLVFTIRFSPDSQRLAYGAKVGRKQLVVVDGQEQKQYDDISASHYVGSLIFSPDNQRLAYGARGSLSLSMGRRKRSVTRSLRKRGRTD